MRQIELFLILNHFMPFYPSNNPEDQNFEKMKKTSGDIIILHKLPKIMIKCYTVPEIWRVTDVILFFIFGYFLPFSPEKSKF